MNVCAASEHDLRGPAPAGRTLVLGMGSTGASCARFLAAREIPAIFADTRAEPGGLAAIGAAVATSAAAIDLRPGGVPDRLPPDVNRVIVSPGVDLGLPVLAEARHQGIQVISDIDLFSGEATAPVIAITGSNGKSTVTSMVGAMLRGAGWRVGVGGNLGTPALDLLDARAQAYVLELSSFQLERSRSVRARAAVVLNVTPDHLDVHGGMDGYAAAKARVYADCDVAVVNRDAPGLAELLPAGIPAVSFGLGTPDRDQFGLRAMPDGLWLARGWELLVPVADLGVTGRHNVANALAAMALAATLAPSAQALTAGLRAYRPLPHRMAVVARRGGVTWIDDSKATNVGAAIASVGSVGDPLVLIAGGDAKGASFESLAAALRNRRCAVVLLGRDAGLLASALQGICPIHRAPDMAAAVQAAAGLAAPGSTVLLAPACSSLDMFADFAERGRVFADAVHAQPGGDNR